MSTKLGGIIVGESVHTVFVYGTLLVGEANHHVAKPNLLNVETGSVRGFLYNVGSYPALVLNEHGMEVVGEWFTVTTEGLAKMDLLEGFSEGRSDNLYERIIVQDSDKSKKGYVYVFDKQKTEFLPLIKTGSWRRRSNIPRTS